MRLISRRQLALSLVLLAALVGSFLLRGRRPWPEPGRAERPAFDPSSVREITWTDHGRTQQIKGEAAVAHALAYVRLEKTAAPSSPEVTVALTFADGSRWGGGYQNGTFAWTEGPRRGEGFLANEDLDALFREGQFALRNRTWLWCTGRVMRLEFGIDEHTFEMRDTHHGWRGQRDGSEARIDTTKLDAWLKAHCEIRVEHYRDLQTYPLGMDAGEIRFVAHFQDGGRYELREKNGTWSIGAQPLAFRSHDWDRAMIELGESVD